MTGATTRRGAVPLSPRIAAALHRAHEAARWAPAEPPSRDGRVMARPVPLDRLFHPFSMVYDEVPGLTRAVAAAHLLRWGVDEPCLADESPPTPLAGFLFANAAGAYVLIRRDDPLPRRRFTAAHELGHLLLHFPPEDYGDGHGDADGGGGGGGRTLSAGTLVMGDESTTVCDAIWEAGEGADGGATESPAAPPPAPAPPGLPSLSLPWREREANRFAAELLMPPVIVRALHAHYSGRYGGSPRFLEGHIAGDLLVSRQAVRYRLAGLGLADGA